MRMGLALAAALVSAPVAAEQPPPFGASVSVRFDAHRLRTVGAKGYADPFAKRLATADDPVRIASVSKLVTALGVMRLVEAGTLDLDRDVSAWLGWTLRNPAFPDAPITLRMLLSHTSGLTEGVDYIVPLGGSIRAKLADPKAWSPSKSFHYANINFPVIASVMEAATGERFDRLMARLVIEPLKLDACYNWTTCSDAAIARAVVLTDGVGNVRRDRLDGKRPACPVVPAADGGCDLSAYVPGTNGALFSPQGGLRISMRDLARIGQMLARHGRGFLKPESVAMLTTPQWRFDGGNGETELGFFCAYGLAVQTLANAREGCHDEPFGDGVRRIGHAGEAYGLRSGLWLDPKSGRGIAFFVTAVPDDALKGKSAFTAAEEAALRD